MKVPLGISRILRGRQWAARAGTRRRQARALIRALERTAVGGRISHRGASCGSSWRRNFSLSLAGQCSRAKRQRTHVKTGGRGDTCSSGRLPTPAWSMVTGKSIHSRGGEKAKLQGGSVTPSASLYAHRTAHPLPLRCAPSCPLPAHRQIAFIIPPLRLPIIRSNRSADRFQPKIGSMSSVIAFQGHPAIALREGRWCPGTSLFRAALYRLSYGHPPASALAPLAPKPGKYSESPPAFQESTWRASSGSDPRVGTDR